MSFEKRVLDTVSKVLQNDNSASFTYGTLFVACAENEARKLFHKLSKEYGSGKVQIAGPIQGEYAYDFI